MRDGRKRVFAGMAITTILPFWKLLKGLLLLVSASPAQSGGEDEGKTDGNNGRRRGRGKPT